MHGVRSESARSQGTLTTQGGGPQRHATIGTLFFPNLSNSSGYGTPLQAEGGGFAAGTGRTPPHTAQASAASLDVGVRRRDQGASGHWQFPGGSLCSGCSARNLREVFVRARPMPPERGTYDSKHPQRRRQTSRSPEYACACHSTVRLRPVSPFVRPSESAVPWSTSNPPAVRAKAAKR
jgi:hypothetical protein